MDDTLLGPDKSISPENFRALDRLRSAGVEIVIASGRHHDVIAAAKKDIPDLEWVVSSHGAAVRNLENGSVHLETSLPAEIVARLHARAEAEGVDLIGYHGEGIHVGSETEWTRLHSFKNAWPLETSRFGDFAPERFQKIMWTGPTSRIDHLSEVLTGELGGLSRVLRSDPELLEFYPAGVSKATGARALLAGRQMEDAVTLAFGDGKNDVEILGWADVSVAMAHGAKAARDAAKFISPAVAPEVAFAHAVDLALGRLETFAAA